MGFDVLQNNNTFVFFENYLNEPARNPHKLLLEVNQRVGG